MNGNEVFQILPQENKMNSQRPHPINIIAIIGGIVAFSIIMFWLLFLNHVGATDVGIAYNSINGHISTQEPGWHVTGITVRTTQLSLLPMRVTIPSGATIINQKMVRFKKEGVRDFINLQGFSMGLGNQQENIMLGYAFSGKRYSFLEILEEPKTDAQ